MRHTHGQPRRCVVSALSPEALCRWFGFVESSLKNAASGSGSGVHAFPYDIPLPWLPGGKSLNGVSPPYAEEAVI